MTTETYHAQRGLCDHPQAVYDKAKARMERRAVEWAGASEILERVVHIKNAFQSHYEWVTTTPPYIATAVEFAKRCLDDGVQEEEAWNQRVLDTQHRLEDAYKQMDAAKQVLLNCCADAASALKDRFVEAPARLKAADDDEDAYPFPSDEAIETMFVRLEALLEQLERIMQGYLQEATP